MTVISDLFEESPIFCIYIEREPIYMYIIKYNTKYIYIHRSIMFLAAVVASVGRGCRVQLSFQYVIDKVNWETNH